jgi:hypothetical protein
MRPDLPSPRLLEPHVMDDAEQRLKEQGAQHEEPDDGVVVDRAVG